MYSTVCLDNIGDMNESEQAPQGGDLLGRRRETDGPVGRLTDEQRARLAAASPEDRDRVLQQVRLQHVRRSLADAVAGGRVSQADADSVLDRLSRGEDVHRMRRELRRRGVLPGRTDESGRGSATTPPKPTRTEDPWRRP